MSEDSGGVAHSRQRALRRLMGGNVRYFRGSRRWRRRKQDGRRRRL